MKCRSRRLMALLLSAAMVVPAAPGAYAEESQTAQEASADTQAEIPAETQVQTQAPTEAQTQAQTQAPTETQTQAQTQTPTEGQTQAQTQTATEAQTQAQTQASTEAQTQPQSPIEDPTQPQSDKQTEAASESQSETETEKEKASFEAKASGVTVTVDLPKTTTLPESTKVSVKAVSGKENDSKIKSALEKAQKAVSKTEILTVSLTDKDGNAVKLPKGTKLSFSFGDGLDLNLRERGEGEIHFLTVGDKAADAGASLKTSQDGLKLLAADVTVSSEAADVTYAAAGLQDRENAGGKLDAEGLKNFAGASAYAAVAGSYDGPEEKLDILTEEDEDKDKKAEAEELLGSLARYSMELADAKSSDQVRVVNLYADDKGKVNTDAEKVTDPLYGIVDEGGSIDVTSGYVVVNIIAPKADTAVDIPKFAVTYTSGQKTEAVVSGKNEEYGGHLIVNLASANGQTGSSYGFVPYTGAADAADSAVGVYLAPDASLTLDADLIGAAYGSSVTVGGKFTASTTSAADNEKPAAENTEDTEKTSESTETEKQTETEASDENANPLQKQTDLGTPGQQKASFAGGLQTLMGAGPDEEADEEDANQAADGQIFKGTISVSVVKEDDENQAISNVSLAIYQIKDADATDLPAPEFKYGWVSGDGAEQLPESVTSQLAAGTYEIREVAIPSTGDEKYLAAAAIVFAIDKTTGKLTSDSIETPTENADFVFKNKKADPSQPLAGNPVTLGVRYLNDTDQAPAYLVGAQLTISNADSPQDQPALAEIPMPKSQTVVDFAQWLPQEGTTGGTAIFKVKETAPSTGYYPTQDVERQLTFTYNDGTAEGSTKGWTLTANSAVTGEDAKDSAKLSTVTFKDAPGVHISSSLLNYDDKELSKLTGSEFSLDLDGAILAAGDYQVYSYDKTTDTYTLSSEQSLKIPDADKKDLIVVLQKPGKTLTVTGTKEVDEDKDKCHFRQTPETVSLEKAADGGLYEAVLKSYPALTINVRSVDTNGNENKGITVTVRGDADYQITGASGQIPAINKASMDDIARKLLSTKVGDLTDVVQGKTNNDGYKFDPIRAKVEAVDKDKATVSVCITSVPLVNYADGDITVRMQTWRDESPKDVKQRLAKEKTFTVGLFEDAAGTAPVGTPQTIKITKNNYASGDSGSVKFTVPVNVQTGNTYYIFVLDENGKPLQDRADRKTIGNGTAIQLTASTFNSAPNLGSSQVQYTVTAKPNLVTLRTVYSKKYVTSHPDEFTGTGTFDIELRVVDSTGKELKVDNMVAEFRVRSADGKLALKNNQKITLKSASTGRKEGISFPVSGIASDMSVTLMSIKTTAGVSLAKDYTLLTASYDNKFSASGDKTGERNFTLADGKENQGPAVFVLRKNDSNEKASLTLTKAVIYKKTPIRVNATYYIGIFADKDHKKLLFKKAMTLKDASSVSDTLKVNVNSQKNRQITLYFAETDRNGKVVKSGKKTGYNISVSPESVTLAAPSSANPDGNMSATVTVTNEVLSGSNAEQRLTDPSSGFAGDSSALADAQSLSESKNLNNKTGDQNPLGRYLIMLVIAAAVIAGAAVILVRNRRKKKKRK